MGALEGLAGGHLSLSAPPSAPSTSPPREVAVRVRDDAYSVCLSDLCIVEGGKARRDCPPLTLCYLPGKKAKFNGGAIGDVIVACNNAEEAFGNEWGFQPATGSGKIPNAFVFDMAKLAESPVHAWLVECLGGTVDGLLLVVTEYVDAGDPFVISYGTKHADIRQVVRRTLGRETTPVILTSETLHGPLGVAVSTFMLGDPQANGCGLMARLFENWDPSIALSTLEAFARVMGKTGTMTPACMLLALLTNMGAADSAELEEAVSAMAPSLAFPSRRSVSRWNLAGWVVSKGKSRLRELERA